jgi:hypothetical protein
MSIAEMASPMVTFAMRNGQEYHKHRHRLGYFQQMWADATSARKILVGALVADGWVG